MFVQVTFADIMVPYGILFHLFHDILVPFSLTHGLLSILLVVVFVVVFLKIR